VARWAAEPELIVKITHLITIMTTREYQTWEKIALMKKLERHKRYFQYSKGRNK
jgi:hypothetical protein